MAQTQARRIVLTGATRGLGRALTDQVVAQGHTVYGCGRSAEQVAALTSKHGKPHDFAVVDVTDAEQVMSWAAAVLQCGAPPDLLINNAAVINRNAPLWQVPREEFDHLIDVNIKGVVNVIRAFVPAMVQQRKGVIVNFSSGWGRSASPEVAPYCASKYAIEGLTLALAQELPPGMAAVPLNPGIIDTDMLRSCFADGAANYPSPEQWARRAAPFILKLGTRDNGRSVSVN
jgi:NAD(P)-dependent dehydrogenase (short-subunit alcohol dehydrogenase family)